MFQCVVEILDQWIDFTFTFTNFSQAHGAADPLYEMKCFLINNTQVNEVGGTD